MKVNSTKKWLSVLVCVVLIAAMALCIAGCDQPGTPSTPTEPTVFADGDQMGQGATTFTFTAETLDGKKASVQVSTDKTSLGDALLELNLIKVDESGFVTTVNGIPYDYNKDGAYWALFLGEEYAIVGVSDVLVENGASYTFKAVRA